MTEKSSGAEIRSRARVAGGLSVMVAMAMGAALVPTAAMGGVRAVAARGGARAAAGIISTVAGGVGGPARATKVALNVCGVSFAGGSVYVGAYQAVRKVSRTGLLTTPAGTGQVAPLGDGGPAVKASFYGPCSVAVDPSGNLVIADSIDYRVRVVAAHTGTFYGRAMTAGDIYTVAGTGRPGFSGDGGPATHAELRFARVVAVDGAGNLAIADPANQRIRMVAERTGTFYGQAMTAGDIYTVAGGGTSGLRDGGPATHAELRTPQGVAVDAAGNLLIADSLHARVRAVAARSGTFYGQAMTAGDIYTVAGNGTVGFSGTGGPATRAKLHFPSGVAVDATGNLLIADSYNERVRMVAVKSGTFYGQAMTAGHIYTIAGTAKTGFSGDGGPATSAELNYPQAVAVDAAGNVLIADSRNLRVRVVAAKSGTFYGQPMTAGHIYTMAGNGAFGLSGNGGPATSAQLDEPQAVAVDSAGNLVIADTSNSQVRVAAARSGTFYGRAMTAGNIYAVAGDGTGGFSGDGGPATSAELDQPQAVAVDAAGNLLISDSSNERVRVVAASSGTFYGQAMTAGHIYTVAGGGTGGLGDGGPATSAELRSPQGVAVDSAGNLLIADEFNLRVRVVAASTGKFYGQAMTAGDIYTVAGGGTGLGNGIPATSANLVPQGVGVDKAGNLLIADGTSRVRVVAPRTGKFYGQAMTAGDIYTVAGNGKVGFSGDGGPATSAELFGPVSVAVDAAGNLLVADTDNGRIREVTG